MKYFTRLKLYKAPNVVLNPETLTSTSYEWYKVTKMINGKLVFNSYNYSPTTVKHKQKILRTLDTLGVTPDLTFDAPRGLDNLEEAIKHYEYKIKTTMEEMVKGTKKKNAERIKLVVKYANTVKTIKELIKEV